MIRRRINQGAIQGKRFQVSDVPDYSTPRGTSKSNDEMRKLAMDLTSFSQEVQGKIDEVKATIPPKTTTTTGDGTTTGPTETPKPPVLPVLEVWRDGNAIVVGTRIWDFTQSDTIRFEVNNLGNQRAQIKAHTLRTLNTMWGTFYGGYALEVPATPGGAINHPGYIPKISISQPFTVQKNRSLIHWVGDTASVEPALEAALNPSATPKTGFNSEKPAHELAAWTAYTQGITISGTAYDATTVKYRVTPNLTIFDPDNFNQTTQHVTRIFFKDSDTIKPHVRVDDPVLISSGVTDPRTYTAKIWLDIDDDAFTIENLGASGTNVGEVYKEKIDRTFYLRRLRTAGSLSLTEDDEYITISGAGGSGTGPIIDRLYNLPTDPTIPRLRVYSHTDIVSGTYYDHFLRGLWYEGNIDMYYDEYDRIVISGSENTYVDNCSSGVGTGQIFHELETLGRNRTFYLRKLLAGSGINITTEMHDVVISASGIDYAIDNCEESTGEGLIYHDETTVNNTRTFHLRKLLAGSGVNIQTTDHSVVITASGANGLDYAIDNCEESTGEGLVYHDETTVDNLRTFHLRKLMAGSGIGIETTDHSIIFTASGSIPHEYTIDNCELGSGTGLIYHDQTTSGTNTAFHLRRILAGSGIEVETVDHDVIVRSTVVDNDTKYDHLAVAHASGTLLRLHDSDDVNDDILFTSSGNTVHITRTSNDVINFEVNASGTRGVVGENVDDCTSLSTDTEFNWYIDYVDDVASGTRNLRFRTFGVQQDLYLSQCGSDYIFTVNTIGIDNRNTLYPSIGVFQKNVQNGGAFTKELYFRGLRPGSGISLYLDESDDKSDIVINSTVSGNRTNLVNVGIGSPIVKDYVASGGDWVYPIRSINSLSDYITVSGSENEVNLGLKYDPRWYSVENACTTSGSSSIIKSVSGTGTSPTDPITYRLKNLLPGDGIDISDYGACSLKIEARPGSGTIYNQVISQESYEPTCALPYDLISRTIEEVTSSGTPTRPIREITRTTYLRNPLDFTYDNGVQLQMQTSSGNLLFKTRNSNWQTSHDDVYIIDSVSNGIEKEHNALPADAWHPLYFDRHNIYENYNNCYEPKYRTPPSYDVRVFKDRNATIPYWYFKPLDTANSLPISEPKSPHSANPDTTIWAVTVRVYIVNGSATNPASTFQTRYPQIALFRNNMFWRTLDVDVMKHSFNDLRTELIVRGIIQQGVLPAYKTWLHGTALIQLSDGDFLDVRYRHKSAFPAYHFIKEGSIDIYKVGMSYMQTLQTNSPTEVVVGGYSF
jgi:hypothetical protein